MTDGPDLFDQAADDVRGMQKSPFRLVLINALDPDTDKAFGVPWSDWIEFEDWRHTAPGREISNLVVRYSLQMRRRGWKTFGIEAVINKIRWEQALKDGPDVDGSRINNNWKKRLAIWAMSRHDDLKDFFSLRDQHERTVAQ